MAHWYFCSTKAIKFGEKPCFCVDGRDLDKVVENIFLSHLKNPPLAFLKIALQEDRKAEEAENLYVLQERERLEYQERHLSEQIENCDPKNRIVYNRFTTQLNKVLEDREQFEQRVKDEESRRNKTRLTEETLQKLCQKASLIPTVWHHSKVTPQEKKQILHCLVKEVRLIPEGDMFKGSIYWRAGEESTFRIYRRVACDNIIRELHTEGCTTKEIIERLARGQTSTGQAFKREPDSFTSIYKRLGLKPNRRPSWILTLQHEASERRQEGETCMTIANDFNRRGLKTAMGMRWTKKAVFDLTGSIPRQPDALLDVHLETFRDAQTRRLTYTQMAREFNERKIPRQNKKPWHPIAIERRWRVLKEQKPIK